MFVEKELHKQNQIQTNIIQTNIPPKACAPTVNMNEIKEDLKASMREDLTRQEKIIDEVEDEIAELEGDVRNMIDIAEGRFENKRDSLQNDYEQKADTIRTDVDRKLAELETRLNKKLQRALDNPLAN